MKESHSKTPSPGAEGDPRLGVRQFLREGSIVIDFAPRTNPTIVDLNEGKPRLLQGVLRKVYEPFRSSPPTNESRDSHAIAP